MDVTVSGSGVGAMRSGDAPMVVRAGLAVVGATCTVRGTNARAVIRLSLRASGAPIYDTTDPRSTKSMSTSQWIEAERLRQIKKYEAQRNR